MLQRASSIRHDQPHAAPHGVAGAANAWHWSSFPHCLAVVGEIHRRRESLGVAHDRNEGARSLIVGQGAQGRKVFSAEDTWDDDALESSSPPPTLAALKVDSVRKAACPVPVFATATRNRPPVSKPASYESGKLLAALPSNVNSSSTSVAAGVPTSPTYLAAHRDRGRHLAPRVPHQAPGLSG